MNALRDYYSSGINLNGGQFGAYRTPTRRHRGQDMSHSTRPGTVAVPAMHAGTVVGKLAPSANHGFGYGIIIRSRLADGNLYDFTYAHGPWASQQKVGEWIPQGKIILHEGNSGATVGSCCHIEQQRVGGGFLDPLPEIRRVGAGAVTPGTSAPAPAPKPAPAAGGSAASFPAAAKYGTGWVKFTQDLLNILGHKLTVDGQDGKKTQDAIYHEQGAAKGNGYGTLTRDRIAGPATVTYLLWAVLKWYARGEAAGGPTTRAYGRRWTGLIQRMLNQLGHKLVVDGLDGAKTGAAIRHEQGAAGRNKYGASLAIDGVAGRSTASYLIWAIAKWRLPWK